MNREKSELDWEYFRKKLRELRDESGLEQEALSQLCGFYDKAVFDYENGKRKPSVETIFRISEFFDLTVEELVRN